MTPLDASYDKEADALYITLASGEVARSIEIDESHYVDVDSAGRPIGVELLYPGRGMNLSAIAGRIGISALSLFEAANSALSDADAYASPTRTASSAIPVPYAVVSFEALAGLGDVASGSVSSGGASRARVVEPA